MSSSDSDDDFAPGGSCYYAYQYQMNEAFCTLFGLDPRYRYESRQIVYAVLDYAKAHNGITNYVFHYDEALWSLFGLPAEKRFKTKRIERYMKHLRLTIRPCPICEKPRPFKSYYPNGLCKDCSEPYKELYKPKYVSLNTDPFYTAIDTTPTSPPDTIVIQGVHCKRTYSDEPILEAIACCPICKAEVKEERRLGAFCTECSRSEELKDANGNRVRFKPLTYWDKAKEGYAVLHYENGEIVKRFHTGMFPCYFRDVLAVAEDTGINDNIIVRFLNKESELVTWEHIRIPKKAELTTQPTIPPSDGDWLDKSYPRWSAF